jgi:hypothetical protein
MDAGNTLGAIVFLAAGTWLGWQVFRGRAVGFLSAMAGEKGGSGGTGASNSAPPQTVHDGALAGVNPAAPQSEFPPAPNVFGDVFGQSGPLSAPQYESPYAPGAPPQYVFPKLGGWEWTP